MHTKLDENTKAEIAKGAPLAASGVLGSEFWEEVQQIVENQPKPEISPRPGVEPR